MATRFLFELFFFLMPFILFGIYRAAIAEAKAEGRKPWPVRWLFGIGLLLSVGSWLLFILLDRGERETCYRETHIVDGVMMPGEEYACDKDFTQIGVPSTDDPGGIASGVGDLGRFASEPDEPSQ